MVGPAYPAIPALVSPPLVVNARRGSAAAEGVAALDPQLDAPLELAARRTAPPIGAPASPLAPSLISPLLAGAAAAAAAAGARPRVSIAAPPPQAKDDARAGWAWATAQTASSFSSSATEGSSAAAGAPHPPSAEDTAEAVAQASAHDILNDSLDALRLGPPHFEPLAAGAQPRQPPPQLPGNHTLFQTQRHMSPYEQARIAHPGQVQPHVFQAEGRVTPSASPTAAVHDGAHRSRSILLRNLAPGIDDDSIRRLLENFGPLRELGAQHRARGGKGSIVATYFDLRHARDAVLQLDSSFQFGRRIEVRFQAPSSSPPPPPSPRQGRNGVAGGNGRQGNGSTPRHLIGKNGNGVYSPESVVSPSFGKSGRGVHSPSNSPPKPVNQGTLVVFNLDPSTTAEEIRELFGSIGDVKEIRGTPNKKHHKFVEFYDVRDAQRALVALNKTELGGKKIKIEISRPGGRVNAGRNSGNTASASVIPESKFSLVTPGQGRVYVPGQTPPSLALTGPSGHANQSQYPQQGTSSMEGRAFQQSLPLSPFSTPFPTPSELYRRQGNPVGTAQNPNPGVGNTYPKHGGSLFPPAALGGAGSPPGAYYNHMQQRRTPPLRALNMGDRNGGHHAGPNGSVDGFNFDLNGVGNTRDLDPRATRSFDLGVEREIDLYRGQPGGTPPPSVFESLQNGARGWPQFQGQRRRMGGLRGPLDAQGAAGNGIFHSGAHSHGAHRTQNALGLFQGHTANGENGYDLIPQSRDDVLDFDSPRFSPLTSSRPSAGHPYGGLIGESHSLDAVARGAGSSHDMYGLDNTPNGKDRFFRNGNSAGTVSPFPGLGVSQHASPLPVDRRYNAMGPNGAGESSDGPQRENMFGNGMNGGGNMGMHRNGHDSGPRRSSPSSNRSHGNGNGHGSSFGGHSNPKFALNIARVVSGEDTRTALMIRNIPNKYNQRMLLVALDENHRGHFDFIYLPIDFKNKCNVGYAFINFTRTAYIPAFYNKFHGHKWLRFNSEKVCEITYARIQGKSNLIGHFQNSSLMNEDPKCRPVVFDSNGKQEEFPVGPNVRTKRGPSVREAANRMENSPPFSPMKSRGRNN